MSQYIPGMQDVNVSIKIENSTLTITFASKTENKLLATKQIDLTLERS
jgi:HSP20 family molecular chaperone IbpA